MLTETEALEHLRLATGIAGLDVGELTLPREGDAVVDGMRLHYLDWGAPGRPPILFLHGGCLTAHTWDLVCLALRDEYRCIALDQRGHGDSEWSPTLDYEPDAHVDDIRGLIEHLGLHRPVLVGHSLGGLNAMTYSRRWAEEVTGVVLVDVGPGARWSAVQRIAQFVTADIDQASLEDLVDRAQAFNRRRDPRLLRSSLLHNLREQHDGSWSWKYDRRRLTPEYFAAVKARLDELSEVAAEITCPVLVVRGDESETWTSEQAAAFAAALPDGRWTTIENAGHSIQGDNPRGLVWVLRRFLEDVEH